MAKSQSPTKPRGRPKSKSEPKTGKERSKSRSRNKSRGRSPTPKGAKARKPSAKRSASRPTSRARSQTRDSDAKPRRARSSTRTPKATSKSATKSAASVEKKEETVQPTRVSRRTVAAREASKGKSVVDSPRDQKESKKPARNANWLDRLSHRVKSFGYRRTLSAIFLLVSLPVFVLGLHLLCTKDRCYIRFDPTIPKTLRVYLDPIVIGYGVAVIALQALLSAIPVGRIVPGFGYRRATYHYRANGFFCLFVSFSLYLAAVFYFRLPHTQIMQTHRFKCVCAATVVTFLYSLMLYAKSFKTSAFHLNHGSSTSAGIENNHIHDFVHGREICPKIGTTFDLGLVVLRSTNFIWLVAIVSSVSQVTAVTTSPDGATSIFVPNNVAYVAVLQAFYIFLGSVYETNILKSAFINQGLGFLSVFISLVLTPFCASLPLRYLVDGKVPDLNRWFYPVISGTYLMGLYFRFYSDAEKYSNARHNGKLLRTGPWGAVRHPNYLGQILCCLAWTVPCGAVFLPYAHLLFVTLLLIYRSYLIEKNVNSEYKSYQNQVKYRLVPFIY